MVPACLLAFMNDGAPPCCVLQIVCPGVGYESSTYEDFLDLSLEVLRAPSLTRALQHFTAREVLDGDNAYRCPTNNKLVRDVSGRAQRSSHASCRWLLVA
jgi:ubiquitin C-terminal hydrolase